MYFYKGMMGARLRSLEMVRKGAVSQLLRSLRRIARYAHTIVLRGDAKRFLFRSAAGAGEHVDVLTDDAIADIRRLESLRTPRARQRSDLHLCAGRNHGTIDRNDADSELFAGSVEWSRVGTMPGAVVISEGPAETRDSPALGARLVKKLLAETHVAEPLDLDLFRWARQFVFAWHVVAGDVPAFGTALLSARLHSSIDDVAQTWY